MDSSIVERIEFDEQCGVLVAAVRPARGQRHRRGIGRRRASGYDQSSGRRRWRTLDLGVVQAFVEFDAPRVRCQVHGVVVAAVP